MRSSVLLAALVGLAILALPVSAASAVPVTYAVSLTSGQAGHLTLDGDQLTAVNVLAFLPSCADGPSAYAMQTGALTAPATITAGTLHAETDAVDDGYGATVHVALDATVSADHHVMSGTMTFTSLQSMFDSGCPATIQRFVAIPLPATIAYDPAKSWTVSAGNFGVDTTPGHIARMKMLVPLTCGSSVNEIDFDALAYGISDIPAAGDGSFSLTLDALDEYQIVRVLTITGTIAGSSVTARFQASSTDVGGTFLADCVGDITMTASPPAPAAPATTPAATPIVHPTPVPTLPPTGGRQVLGRRSGPSAIFDWAELRLGRGASYLYYFVVDRLRCSGGATHVRVVVGGGRAHYVSCKLSRGFASAPQAAGVNYGLTAQAVQLRRGRIVRRGPVVPTLLHMRQADDGWTPIARLPGRPPTV